MDTRNTTKRDSILFFVKIQLQEPNGSNRKRDKFRGTKDANFLNILMASKLAANMEIGKAAKGVPEILENGNARDLPFSNETTSPANIVETGTMKDEEVGFVWMLIIFKASMTLLI